MKLKINSRRHSRNEASHLFCILYLNINIFSDLKYIIPFQATDTYDYCMNNDEALFNELKSPYMFLLIQFDIVLYQRIFINKVIYCI